MNSEPHTNTLGIDVAKDWLDICSGTSTLRINNTRKAIKSFLMTLSSTFTVGVESTGMYHECFVELSLKAKHTVYLIDAYRLSRYRGAVGVRAKTDEQDAQLIYRYLNAEMVYLRAFQPPSAAVKRLHRLLRARGKLTQLKGSIGQALEHIKELAHTRKSLLARIDRALALIDKRTLECLDQAGYLEDYKRCQAIPGIGPINAAALTMAYHRGDFRNADAFVAFMGLDVRVRESGYYRGKRKLTKRGNPELRRLLFNAARAGAKTAHWSDYYLSLRARGLSTTAASVALARKLARVAFALLRDKSTFHPA